MGMNKKAVSRQLILLAFVLGLVIFGWGPDDLPGFFADRARAAFMVLLAVMAAIAATACPAVQPFRKGKQPVAVRLMAIWIVIGIVFVWFLPYGDRRGLLTFVESQGLRYTGLVLLAVGTIVRMVGFRALGPQFSVYVTLQEGHTLIQTSIYSVVRHPLYLGGLLFMPGLALTFRSWLAIPVSVSAAIFVLIRIRQEEKLLDEHFGSEFEAYRRRTWRLIPYVY